MTANLALIEVSIKEEEPTDYGLVDKFNVPRPPVHSLSLSGTLVSDSQDKKATFYPYNNKGQVLYNVGAY